MEPQQHPQGWGWFLCSPSGAHPSPRCPHMWVPSILPLLLSSHLCTPRFTPCVSPLLSATVRSPPGLAKTPLSALGLKPHNPADILLHPTGGE